MDGWTGLACLGRVEAIHGLNEVREGPTGRLVLCSARTHMHTRVTANSGVYVMCMCVREYEGR